MKAPPEYCLLALNLQNHMKTKHPAFAKDDGVA